MIVIILFQNNYIELIIKSPQSIYLFREILPSDNIKDCCVLKKIIFKRYLIIITIKNGINYKIEC